MKLVGSDDRRYPIPQEEKENTSVGYFADSKSKESFGTGFAVFDQFTILTAAHLFADKGAWLPEVSTQKALDVSKVKFASPDCGTTHAVKTIEALTLDPDRYPAKDIALTRLAQPLCQRAKPYGKRNTWFPQPYIPQGEFAECDNAEDAMQAMRTILNAARAGVFDDALEDPRKRRQEHAQKMIRARDKCGFHRMHQHEGQSLLPAQVEVPMQHVSHGRTVQAEAL